MSLEITERIGEADVEYRVDYDYNVRDRSFEVTSMQVKTATGWKPTTREPLCLAEAVRDQQFDLRAGI